MVDDKSCYPVIHSTISVLITHKLLSLSCSRFHGAKLSVLFQFIKCIYFQLVLSFMLMYADEAEHVTNESSYTGGLSTSEEINLIPKKMIYNRRKCSYFEDD